MTQPAGGARWPLTLALALVATCTGAGMDRPPDVRAATEGPSTGGIYLREDFSGYRSIAEMAASPQSRYLPFGAWHSPNRMSLDTAHGFRGSRQALRYDYRRGDPKEFTILLPIRPPDHSEFWMEIWAKFSSNFCTAHPGRDVAGALKFILFKLPDYSRMDLVAGLFPNQACDEAQWWSASMDARRPGGAIEERVGDYRPRWDGQWHRYRFHGRLSSAPGAADGAYEVWVDDAQWVDRQGVDTRVKGGTVHYTRWAEFNLGANLNDGSARDMSLWWGLVTIWTSAPSW